MTTVFVSYPGGEHWSMLWELHAIEAEQAAASLAEQRARFNDVPRSLPPHVFKRETQQRN